MTHIIMNKLTVEEQTVTFTGLIRKVGYYKDTLPLMVITFPKGVATHIPFRNRERVAINFVIGNERYTAGIRTTARLSILTLCPDMADMAGNVVRLADVILRHGLQNRGMVGLTFSRGELVFVETVDDENCVGKRRRRRKFQL